MRLPSPEIIGSRLSLRKARATPTRLIMKTTTEKRECQDIRRRRAPRHPGALLREIVLPASGLNQTELALRVNVSRRTVNMILNEQRPVTPDLAHRLGRVFGNGPRLWLNMQRALDLWNAEQENAALYAEIKPVETRELLAA